MKQTYELRYLSEQMSKTTRYGTIASLAALVAIPLFYYLDQKELGLGHTLPWRVLGMLGAVGFLTGRLFNLSPRTGLLLHGITLSTYLLMMIGLSVEVYTSSAYEEEQQFAVTTGVITVWMVITLIAQGSRRIMMWVSGGAMLFYAGLIFAQDLDNLGYVLSVMLVGFFALLLLRNQDRQEREKSFYLFELENREQRIAQQREELEMANSNLLGFNYAITHDLKGPLRRVQSFTQLVERKLQSEKQGEMEEFFAHIRSNLHKIQEIIDGLLLLSRIGKSAMDIQEINLKEEALMVWNELLTPELEEKVELRVEEVGCVKADPKLVWHIFNNFFTNALKYSQYQEHPVIKVGGYRENAEQIMFVSDNGAGFPADLASQIGRPFKRLHSTHEFEGTGIGLAIVRQIVDLHGGRFWAEGKEGEGATFYCSFPLRSQADATATA